MNAPANLPAANMAIWNALSRTDPKHTKQFKRSGGLSGTALKPIWIVQRLTEQFGPVGKGWGMGRPDFQVVHTAEEVMVYCTVACWCTHPDNEFYGVGGDKVVAKNKYGLQSDDEAFKKAFTDAVGNAFKFLGVGADIHMGQFDDSKYVQEVAREFAGGHSQEGAVSPRQTESAPKGWREESDLYPNPSKLHKGLTSLERELAGCGDSEMVYGLTATHEWTEFVRVAEKHAPHYLRGGDPAPPEFCGLLNIAADLVAKFDGEIADNMAALART